MGKKNPRELRSEREEILKSCIAMVDKVDAGRRDFTDAEQKEYDAKLKQAESLLAQAERLEKMPSDREMARATERLSLFDGQWQHGMPGLEFVTEDGESIRALALGESFAAETRSIWRGGDEDAGQLSVGRTVRGIVTGNWRGAEAEKRAMGTLDGTLGGYLLGEPISAQVIDLARAESVLNQAGALTIPMDTSTLAIARVSQDPTPIWKQENAKATAVTPVIGGLKLVAKTIFAVVAASLELIEDAPNAANVIETSLRGALGLELDRVGLFGSGAGNEPRGIYNDPDLGLVDLGTNGAALTSFAKFVDACQKVLEANGDPVTVIYSPRTAATLGKLVSAVDNQPLMRPTMVEELRHLVSTQIPNTLTWGSANNASAAFLGDFRQVLYGIRNSIVLEVTREGGEAFERGQVLIRAQARVDVITRRPPQLCAIKGIIP